MKLTYHVLWFEDQFDEITGYLESFEDIITDAGFELKITQKTSISERDINALATELHNYNPYDVIIFDYDLGQHSKNGIDIASSLRSKIYTDMIFYSGKEAISLREMLFKQEIDGVFVVARSDFTDDVEPIIEDHIKKISDINNVRGVVMSAMSDIDRSMRSIICSKYEGLDENEKNVVFLKAKKRVTRSCIGHLKKIETLDSFNELLDNPHITDFDKLRRALLSMFEKGSHEFTQLDIGSTLHKTQSERNNLAHQKDEYTSDGRLLLHPPHGDPKEYNFEEFKRLRKQLQEIKDFIDGC